MFPVSFSGVTQIGQPWNHFRVVNHHKPAVCDDSKSVLTLETDQWRWPKKPIIFISDLHADKLAFDTSLIASNAVTISRKGHYRLTPFGKQATFIIGGDCLDKGPANLTLLRAIQQFMQTGADLKILAGNHDLRLFMGLKAIGINKQVGTEHMFVRMGNKAIPLLKEVFDTYLANTPWQEDTPDYPVCKMHLFPRDEWFEEFPLFAQAANAKKAFSKKAMSKEAIATEIKKMRTKAANFEDKCKKHGMTLRQVYAAAKQCEYLFLDRHGEFSWFFRSLKLALRRGSFLFVHAGLDDEISEKIQQDGISALNKDFQHAIHQDLFQFYFSSMSSLFRTKYRKSDPVFSPYGVDLIKQRGIHTVVHGHVNQCTGQQMSLQQGLLHIEGDVTLDKNSRIKEGLKGAGFGATIIHPDKLVLGISADFPSTKVFSAQSSRSELFVVN
jgi:hypothetical protein